MGGHQRPHSITDFDQIRSPSASNLQNFYANQRFQPRHNEAEQMQQAKRRMAAQRERELRNYHQEQQYNRNVMAEISTQGKPERSISPNTMNEEDRRELIARQHRALYGNEGASFYEGNSFGEDDHTPRPNTQPAGPPGGAIGGRGPSPMAYNAFGMSQEQNQTSPAETSQQYTGHEQINGKGPSPRPQQNRSRANSTSSPASNTQGFRVFDNAAQQSSRTSNSSPGGSPPRQNKPSTVPIGSSVAPIGTRPTQGQAVHPALSKRSTTPLPSPLSYGFAPSEAVASNNNNSTERSTSAASNPQSGAKESSVGNMNWGSNSAVWGKTPLGVQASVWG
ncbi:hypothetical protein MMC13_002603 [Lambiella insularis]|nr:hypothetical protein [Lambiella insularis]